MAGIYFSFIPELASDLLIFVNKAEELEGSIGLYKLSSVWVK